MKLLEIKNTISEMKFHRVELIALDISGKKRSVNLKI